jgi:hypothetical protein
VREDLHHDARIGDGPKDAHVPNRGGWGCGTR